MAGRHPERDLEPNAGRAADPGAARAESARARWRSARTFDDLCTLGAAFLEGRCAHFPGWGAPETDVETDAIRAPLVALHRRGFLSVASQPAFEGHRDGRDVRQRAFVTGFARDELARKLVDSRAIVVRVWFGDGSSNVAENLGADPEPMTLEDGVARVVAGHAAREVELELLAEDLDETALHALRTAAFVTAWDPKFGRERFLWDECDRLAAN